MKNMLIVGFGTMGRAIARGLKAASPITLTAIDPMDEAAATAKSMGIEHHKSLADLSTTRNSMYWSMLDAVILAVKPQHALPTLQELKTIMIPQIQGQGDTKPSFISIMAGVPCALLAKHLNTKRIIRFMPTIGAMARKSVTGIYIYADSTNPPSRDLTSIATEIASAIGSVQFFSKEEDLTAITGLAGSGIAFIATFLEAMILAGVREGIPISQAKEIVLSTTESIHALLTTKKPSIHTTKEAPSTAPAPTEESAVESAVEALFTTTNDLIQAVCSPAGTTVEGIRTLHDKQLYSAVMEAVNSSCKRARNIENALIQSTTSTDAMNKNPLPHKTQP